MFSTKFIAATTEFSTYEKEIPAPYFRRSFSLNRPVQSATVTICGLGFYELYINGKRITKGALAPYISNPDDLLYYDSYDLSDYLTDGENVLGVLLGNGMLNCPGGEIWDMEKARYRSAPKVALALELTYTSGEREVITADEQFKVHSSPILFDDLRCGEIYDARREIPGWNLPGFDDSGWAHAIPAETPRGETVLCAAEPIVVTKELPPVSVVRGRISMQSNPRNDLPVIPLAEDENVEGFLYDFGANLAGNIRLNIQGKTGQKVCIQFGELLAEDGGLDLRGMHFQPHRRNHRVTYYLKGGAAEEYTPYFSYQGFRYCLVTGITEQQATKDLLTYAVMNSDLKKNGGFSCSDEIMNRLQEATVNSDLANFYYFPTDCPHREKNGWTADAALSAEQMLFNLTPENSYHEWLRNIRKAQREDGALPGIIPTSGWGFAWGNGPAWDSVIVYLPYFTWLYRGDLAIIRENAHAIMKYLDYISVKRDPIGLLHIGLGDWVPVQHATPLEVTDTLVSMDLCRKSAVLFDAVGMKLQKQFALHLYGELRAAARTALIESDGATVMGHTQTAQCMGIQYGLFEDGEKKAAFDVLLRYIDEADGHMDVGCLGARILFHTLSDFGHSELAYQMITRPDYPSYGHWIVKENATSLFEAFQKEGAQPNSKNHHFLGDISSWFFRHIVGVKVNPFARDVNELELSPAFIEALSHAEGYHIHPNGRIEMAWRREGEKVLLKISVPEGCHGYIRLPAGYETEQRGNLTVLPLHSGEITAVKK